jgi:hypothetical protein
MKHVMTTFAVRKETIMKSLTRLAAGFALAFGLSTVAHAAVIPFPTTNPYSTNNAGFCGPLPFVGGSPCDISYSFTLPSTYDVTIDLLAFGGFGSFSWQLTGTSLGSPSPIGPSFVIGSLVHLETQLGPGPYSFDFHFASAAGGYHFEISGTPVSGVPIPGATLLFLSGLGALGAAQRKFGKRTAIQDADETISA